MAWYHMPGEAQDVAICSRIRLIRNVAEYPFPARLDAGRARELMDRVGEVLIPNGFVRLEPTELPRAAAFALVEGQYISPSLVRESLPHAVFLNEPCGLSVAVGGEEHLTLRGVGAGLSICDTAEAVLRIEGLLDEAMGLAFDEHLGYLTRSPADVGTGLCADTLLCMPQSEMAVRGHSLPSLQVRRVGAEGCGLYRASVKAVLGMREEEALALLERGVRRLIDGERQRRAAISGEARDRLIDRLERAEAVLKAAHLLSAEELVERLSDLRVGAAMGILPRVKVEALTALLIEGMPAHLSRSAPGESVSEHDRALMRARAARALSTGGCA